MSSEYLPIDAAFVLIHPVGKVIGFRLIKRMLKIYNIYLNFYNISFHDFQKKELKAPLIARFTQKHKKCELAVYNILRYNKLPFRKTSNVALKHKICDVKRPKFESRWKNYHSNILCEVGCADTYPRFNKIVDILRDLKPISVTEIGANQGLLSSLIIKDI